MSDRYVCSAESTARHEPLFATGSQVRRWLLVEVRGAWGEDAVHDGALGEHVPAHWKDHLRRRHIRVICIRSHLRREEAGVRLYTCSAPRPGGDPPVLWRGDVASLADVSEIAAELTAATTPGDGWVASDDQLILVCTNGRHDQCCANRGRPVIRALRDSTWADRVWECSHIGGDRFAANVVQLPHSLYFGRVEPHTAADLVESLDAGRIELAHFRGRTSYTLAEQAVEHFVRNRFEIDTFDGVIVEPGGGNGTFRVRIDDGVVEVRIRRHFESVSEPLTCTGTPDQLVPVYELESISPAG